MPRDRAASGVANTERALATLLANTKTRRRPDSLVTVASLVRTLSRSMGGDKRVAQAVGISTEMLRKFKSVDKLCPEVKALFRQRSLDSVSEAHYLSHFGPAAQQLLADELMREQMTSDDLKVLVPMMASSPRSSAHDLLKRLKGSRDVHVYVAYFHVPGRGFDSSAARRRIEEVVGAEGLLSLKASGDVGEVRLSRAGRALLQRAARERGLSARRLIDASVSGHTTRAVSNA
jgi:hypothetical protein